MERARRLALALGMRPGAPGARSWLDVLFVAWLGWLYDLMNNLAAVRQGLAEAHARSLLHAEKVLHVDVELSLNKWLAARHTLSSIAVLWYDNVHGIVVIGTFLVLWWRRPDLLARLRGVLGLVSVGALAVFWSYPVAPPRMLVAHGYIDLVAKVHHLPVWRAGAVASDSNQLAAFPSLHLAWGIWASIAVFAMTRRRWLRALAVAYLLITVLAVMATANHFLLDALAGALLTAAIALAVTHVAERWGRPTAAQAAAAARPG